MPDDQGGKHKSFWTTLPGLFTGLAALIGAVATLLVTLNQIGAIGKQSDVGNGGNGADVAGSGGAGSGGTGTPPPPPRENNFRVVELRLRARPATYTGKCPVTIKFSGRISVVGGSGTVSYKFLRSDGASAPIQTINFTEPGSRTVTTSWRLGKSYSGWQAIQVFDPGEQQSRRATFRIVCTNTLVPKPLVPKQPALNTR